MNDKDDQNKRPDEEANADQFHADNEFGLPEVEYSPLEREQSEIAEDRFQPESIQSRQNIQPKQKKSSWPMWMALVVILLLAGIFVYFFVFKDNANDQIAKNKQQNAGTVVIEEKPKPIEEPEETVEPEVAPKGSVSVISSRTGKYHLIVGSFIDSDLARDFAAKLADEGNNAKIIEPSGTRKFYRLSVKEAESIPQLETELEEMRAKYGENVWIVKY